MNERTFARLSSGRRLSIAVAVAAVYVLVATLSFLVTLPPGNISPIFPSAGIALAAVLILGRGALPAVFAGSLAANLVFFAINYPGSLFSFKVPAVSLCIAAGATTGAWVGATLVKKLCRGDAPLSNGPHVLSLLFGGALVGGLFSPTFGVGTLALAGFVLPGKFGFSWLTWWAGDAIGCIVMAPFVLAWWGASRRRARHERFVERLLRIGEMALLAVATGAVCYYAFFGARHVDYVSLVVLVWAAFRFGMRGVTLVSLVVSCAAAVGTVSGTSAFSTGEVVPTLLLLYAYLGSTVVCALILTGVLDELRRVATARQLGEERLHLATAAAAIGVWDWDVRADKLVWDDSMLRLYGVRREDFAGAHKTWSKRLHPEDVVATNAAIRAALDGEREYVIEFRIIRPDGEVRHLRASAHIFRDDDGNAVRLVGVSIDITERRATEAKLRECEERCRRLAAGEG